MAERRPLVLVGGQIRQLAEDDEVITVPPVGFQVRVQSDLDVLDYRGMTLLHSGVMVPESAYPAYPASTLGLQSAAEWETQATGIIQYLLGLATDNNGVWVAGMQNGNLRRSTDNGLTWAEIANTYSPDYSTEHACIATDGNGVWLAGGRSTYYQYAARLPHVYRSIDNGLTWTSQTVPITGSAGDWGRVMAMDTDGAGMWLRMAHVYSNSAGNFSYLLLQRSVDNGATWANLGSVTAAHYSLARGGPGVWKLFMSGHTQTSTDNGATWSNYATEPTGVSNPPYASDSDGNGVWVFADSTGGNLYRSADNGKTWHQVASGAGAIYSLRTNRAGTWVAIGAAQMLRSADNGASWVSVPSGGKNFGQYNRVAPSGSGLWLASTQAATGRLMRAQSDLIGIPVREPGLYLRVA